MNKALSGVFLHPKSRDLILKNKDAIVQRLFIGIQPVGDVIQFLLNAGTKGELKNRLEDLNIEDLVHPFIFFQTSKGFFRYERIGRIVFEPYEVRHKDTKFTEAIEVNRPLKDLILNHVNAIGGSFDNIIEYRPGDQNSQVFVKDFLTANGLNTKELENFYKQKTEQIMKGFDSTNQLVKKIVLFGLASDVAVRG